MALCQDLTVILDGSDSYSLTTGMLDAGSVADCGLASMSLDINTLDCSHTGPPAAVTLTVLDDSSNIGQCVSNITVLDTIPPTLSPCPADIPIACSPIVAWMLPTVGDNCSAVLTSTYASGDPLPLSLIHI